MIEIEVSGTDTATFGDMTVRSKRAPICELARLIEATGVRPLAPVVVKRNGKVAIMPMPLGWWADRTVSEGDQGTRFARYVAFDAKAVFGGAKE